MKACPGRGGALSLSLRVAVLSPFLHRTSEVHVYTGSLPPQQTGPAGCDLHRTTLLGSSSGHRRPASRVGESGSTVVSPEAGATATPARGLCVWGGQPSQAPSHTDGRGLSSAH